MKSVAPGPSTSPVEVTNVSPHGFWLFIGQRELFLPFRTFPWFKEASVAAITHVELPSPHHLYWPDLDVHLGWTQFLQAVDPAELRKAQQRSADFNRRNGAAIRKLREEAGIRQASVGGAYRTPVPPHRAGGMPGHDRCAEGAGQSSRPRR